MDGVESVKLPRISPELALAVGGLVARVWPKPGKNAAFRARQLTDLGVAYKGPAAQAPELFFIRYGEDITAAAVMEPREISFSEGNASEAMLVFGLGKVCSDPDRRGEGLGVRVVQGAFGMIDNGLAPYSLFQTSYAVQPFYEHLGACLVENRVMNSLGEIPSANPFWDEVVMRYPSGGDWPAGVIDLRGPGF